MTPGDKGLVSDTAIIGAGWAGLSAAHRLTQAGRQVTLFEAAPIPGGRARPADISLAGQRVRLDNGQHLLIGGYRQTLSLMRAAHGQQDSRDPPGLLRLPLQFSSARSSLRRRGPAQPGLLIGILTARGFSFKSRLAIASLGARLAIARWQTPPRETVSQLLSRLGQTSEAIEQFWSPMCIAALNTAPTTACAQVFANVLHDSMLAGLNSSDFLIPRSDLGELLPTPLLARLAGQGATIRLSNPVKRLRPETDGDATARWQVHTRSGIQRFKQVILATPIHVSARLLDQISPAISKQLAQFTFESIQTVYLAWRHEDAPKIAPVTMLEQPDPAAFPGQWLFARAPQAGLTLASVVVSAPPASSRLDNDELSDRVCRQLIQQYQLPRPADALAIHEKRATFSCTPERPLTSHDKVNGNTLPAGIRLAGDYCWPRYPATLESAVLSGISAASDLLD